jgi:hypothetical protein
MARPKRTETSVTKSLNDDCVVLRGVSVPLISDLGGAFIADCSRNRERLMNDDRICEKYGISPETYASFAKNKELRLKIDAEHERRVRNGDAARESAAKLFAEAPEVLGEILNDKQANARHRIEAARELRATAGTGSEGAPAAERFHIVIDLGEDRKLEINKRIAPLTPEEAKENLDVDAE